MRLMDRGDRDAAEALLRRAGAVVRRLRPDIHIAVELAAADARGLVLRRPDAKSRIAYQAMEGVAPRAS